MKTDPKATAARAFVRSLNILLKFARLYGHDHARVAEQLSVAWQELRTAIPEGAETGLLLGASGTQLLLDGVPLEGSPAEKQFSQLLSAAGLASLQFTPQVTQAELTKFIHAFPTGKAKPAELAVQLKSAIADAKGIRVNEVCFVATDSRLKESSLAAQIAAASMGDQQDQFRKMLNDPKKLLELIAAAEGSKTGAEAGPAGEGAGPGAGEGWGGGTVAARDSGDSVGALGAGTAEGDVGWGAGPGAGSGKGSGTGSGQSRGSGALGIGTGPVGLGSGPGWGAGLGGGIGKGPGSGGRMFGGPDDESIYRILRALATFGSIATSPNPSAATVEFQDQVSQLPGKAQETLRNALAGLAEQGKNKKLDEGVLIQLAEHLSIRFALEQFERGEVKVNAVRQMLDRMNQEIERLRNILGQHEDKMAEAGILVESHREMLDRVFWASVPESAKREVLLSEEAWCIPPKNVQSYVTDLLKQGERADAVSILQNYARCADSEEPDARKRAATGLSEMAGLYAEADPRLLQEALRHIGLRLSLEQDPDLQSLVSATFVRLSQEAATHRQFAAMSQALNLIEAVEGQRPGIGKTLRGKMGIEERVPEFVEEALRARGLAAGLTGVLKHMPQTAMEQLSSRFNRCQFRSDLENVAGLAQDLGDEALQYLRDTLRGGAVAEATEMVGLLARLDMHATETFLPARMKEFPRTAQDRVVRQVAASGAHGGCRLLLALLDYVDPLVMPLVIDEVGMTGDREGLGRLLTIADGDLPADAAPYLRIKALEALGRLRAPESVNTLRRIVEAKKIFGWANAQELRIAAFQALAKMDPEWAKKFLPESGIDAADLALEPLEIPVGSKFVRQRRHARIRLQKSVAAVSTNLKQNCRMEIKTASLAGGLATTNMHLAPGTKVQLRMQLGLRNVQATALMRDYRAQDMSFEIIDIGLEERGRLRKLLMESYGKANLE
ncbi:MAG TPA: HEAT repeat domain-containing protein [Candidatus Acidoferrum sp.]|nr:HEAT repeat domain-containing protein [Candidatus Acidoferrum sp.]